MRPAGWKLFGHAMFELSQLNVTEVAKFVQRNFQNLFTKARHPVNKYIWAWNATCPPPPPCPCSFSPGGPPAYTAGSPISLATGNTYIEQKDVRIPGLTGGLNLVRRWNSIWPASQSALQVVLFGPNWRSTYEDQVVVGIYNYIKYLRGDGSFWSFGTASNTPGSWAPAAPQNVSALLTTPSTANPYWTITFQNGEQRRFDGTSGMLTAIIDSN